MMRFDARLQRQVGDFRDRILSDPLEVLDPEGVVHHEFVSGNHGRKLDFDKIPTDSDFYIEWVALCARAMRARYAGRLPDALVGIAGGANRLSESVSRLLGGGVLHLSTVKIDAKSVELSTEALRAMRDNNVRSAVTIDDAGTTGSTAATAVTQLRCLGVEHIEAFSTWQRSPSLPRLDVLGVSYGAMIFEPLPVFSPEECLANPEGFCAQGVPLIKHA